MKASQDQTYIASVVAMYWFVSISMVYLNKVLMSSEGISIPAPLFVTWFQCIVTAAICYVAGEVGEQSRKNDYKILAANDDDAESSDKKPSFLSQFPKANYNVLTGQRVFPLSIVFVGMITANNLCLKWVEVSFYNVARSLTIVFNVVFTNLLLGSTTSTPTMGCLAIVIIGFLIGSSGEVNFSMRGTVAGVLSSLFVSLNSIYTKKVLPFFSGIFWLAMWVAGFFGFSIGIVTVLQIKATSPLSHNISGTAKAAVQSMLAFRIWGNTPTFMGILGIFTVLGGSLLYTFVKINENKKPAPSLKDSPKDLERQLDTAHSPGRMKD